MTSAALGSQHWSTQPWEEDTHHRQVIKIKPSGLRPRLPVARRSARVNVTPRHAQGPTPDPAPKLQHAPNAASSPPKRTGSQLAKLLQEVLKKDYSVGILFMGIIGRGTVVLKDLIKPFLPKLPGVEVDALLKPGASPLSSGATDSPTGTPVKAPHESQSISSLLLSLGLPQEHVQEVLASSLIPEDQPLMDLLGAGGSRGAAPRGGSTTPAQVPADWAGADVTADQWGLSDLEISRELLRAASMQVSEAGEAARELLSQAWAQVHARLPSSPPDVNLRQLIKDNTGIDPDDIPMFSNVLEGFTSLAQSSSAIIGSALRGLGDSGAGGGGRGSWWGNFGSSSDDGPESPQPRELLMHWLRLYLGFSLILPSDTLIHVLRCMLQSTQPALMPWQGAGPPLDVLPRQLKPPQLAGLAQTATGQLNVGHPSTTDAINASHRHFHDVLSEMIRHVDKPGQRAATQLLEQLQVDMPCASRDSLVSPLRGSTLAAMAQLMTYGSTLPDIANAVTTLQSRAEQAEQEAMQLVVQRMTTNVFRQVLQAEQADVVVPAAGHGVMRDAMSAGMQTEAMLVNDYVQTSVITAAASTQTPQQPSPIEAGVADDASAAPDITTITTTQSLQQQLAQFKHLNAELTAENSQLRAAAASQRAHEELPAVQSLLQLEQQRVQELMGQIASLTSTRQHNEALLHQQHTLGLQVSQLRDLQLCADERVASVSVECCELRQQLDGAAQRELQLSSELEQLKGASQQLSDLCSQQYADLASLTEQLESSRAMNDQLGSKLHELIVSTQALQAVLDQQSQGKSILQQVASDTREAAPVVDILVDVIEQDRRRTHELASLCDEGFILVQRLDSQLKAHQASAGGHQLAAERAAEEHALLMDALEQERSSVMQLSGLLQQEASKVQELQHRVAAQQSAHQELMDAWNLEMTGKDASLSQVSAELASARQDMHVLRVQAANTHQQAAQELVRHSVQLATVKALHACQLSELQAEVAILQGAATRSKVDGTVAVAMQTDAPCMSDMQLDDLHTLEEQLQKQLLELQSEIAGRQGHDGVAGGKGPLVTRSGRWTSRMQAMVERIQATQGVASSEVQEEQAVEQASEASQVATASEPVAAAGIAGTAGVRHLMVAPPTRLPRLQLPVKVVDDQEAFVLPTPPMSIGTDRSSGRQVSIQQLLSSRRSTATSGGGSSDTRPPRVSQSSSSGAAVKRRGTATSTATATTTLSLPGQESEVYCGQPQPHTTPLALAAADASVPGAAALAQECAHPDHDRAAAAPGAGGQAGTRWSTADSFDEVRHEALGVVYNKVVYDNPMASYEEMYTNPVAKRGTLAGSDQRVTDEEPGVVAGAAAGGGLPGLSVAPAPDGHPGAHDTLSASQRAQIEAWAQAATIPSVSGYVQPDTSTGYASGWGEGAAGRTTAELVSTQPAQAMELDPMDDVPEPILAASIDFQRSAHVGPGPLGHALHAQRDTVSSFGSSQVEPQLGPPQLSRLSSGVRAGSTASLVRDSGYKVDSAKMGCLPRPKSFRSKHLGSSGGGGGGADVLVVGGDAVDVDERGSECSGWSAATSTTSKRSLSQRMSRKLSKMFSSFKEPRQSKAGSLADS